VPTLNSENNKVKAMLSFFCWTEYVLASCEHNCRYFILKAL